MNQRKRYLFWIALTEAIGALAGWLSQDAVAAFGSSFTQSTLTPPGWIFPIVWGILYALMGIGAARVAATEKQTGLNLWIIQLAVNFFWPLLFFNAHAFGFAALWLGLLWVLVLLMILRFRKADPVAAVLQLPYLLWLTFALYLNLAVWQMNPKI